MESIKISEIIKKDPNCLENGKLALGLLFTIEKRVKSVVSKSPEDYLDIIVKHNPHTYAMYLLELPKIHGNFDLFHGQVNKILTNNNTEPPLEMDMPIEQYVRIYDDFMNEARQAAKEIVTREVEGRFKTKAKDHPLSPLLSLIKSAIDDEECEITIVDRLPK